MSKLITKERLVSGGIGAALVSLGYGIYRHLHPKYGFQPKHHGLYGEGDGDNERGEYGHEKHHHHKHKDR